MKTKLKLFPLIILTLVGIINSGEANDVLNPSPEFMCHASSPKNNFLEFSNSLVRSACERVVASSECQDLYKNLDLKYENSKTYKLNCADEDEKLKNLGDFYLGCYSGVFNALVGDWARSLGKSAIETFDKIKEDEICNSSLERKRELYQSHNELLPPELQLSLPEDLRLKNNSCSTIRKSIYQEHRYRLVELHQFEKKSPLTSREIINAAKNILENLEIPIECYSPRKQAELICKAATYVGTAVIPVAASARLKLIAGVEKIQKSKLVHTPPAIPPKSQKVLQEASKAVPRASLAEIKSAIASLKSENFMNMNNEQILDVLNKKYSMLTMPANPKKKMDQVAFRNHIENKMAATTGPTRLATEDDIAGIVGIAQRLQKDVMADKNRGFLSSEISASEMSALVKEKLVLVHDNGQGVVAFFATYSPLANYAKSKKSWIDDAAFSGLSSKADLRASSVVVRAVVTAPNGPAKAAMEMERKYIEILKENGGGMILGKISLSPFNERSFALHITSGSRVVGVMKDSSGQVWAVIGKNI